MSFLRLFKQSDLFMVPARIGLNCLQGLRGYYSEPPRREGEDAGYAQSVFKGYEYLLGKAGETFAGKRVLEIGPGNSAAVARLMLEAGAAEVVGLDRFTYKKSPAAGERWRLVQGVPLEGAEKVLGREGFDLAVSWSVMEHVREPAAAYRSLAALLRPGGVAVHSIDLTHHGMWGEKHPLYFLTFSDTLWRLMGSHRGIPNRLRAEGHLLWAKEAGLEIVEVDLQRTLALEVIEAIRPSLAAPFRELSTEELRGTRLLLAVQKEKEQR